MYVLPYGSCVQLFLVVAQAVDALSIPVFRTFLIYNLTYHFDLGLLP